MTDTTAPVADRSRGTEALDSIQLTNRLALTFTKHPTIVLVCYYTVQAAKSTTGKDQMTQCKHTQHQTSSSAMAERPCDNMSKCVKSAILRRWVILRLMDRITTPKTALVSHAVKSIYHTLNWISNTSDKNRKPRKKHSIT